VTRIEVKLVRLSIGALVAQEKENVGQIKGDC